MVQGAGIDLNPSAARVLHPFGVITQDDSSTPTIRFGIGHDRVEDGTIPHLLVKLWSVDQR